MVHIQKKTVKGREYYYLEHSFRAGKIVHNKQSYLGSAIPKNIDLVKKEFMVKIDQEKWQAVLNAIKKGFSRETKALPKSIQSKELESFVVKFTYDTQRIEGSTLTLRETANLLQKGITPKDKPLHDIKEAEKHKELFYEMQSYQKDLSLAVILYWHKKLLGQTKPDLAGKVRNYGVAISGSRFAPPSPVEIGPLLSDFMQWYHQHKDKINPVELAALVHLKFVTIHPFGDGNGRISRLLMNFVLRKKSYPLLDVPYENRNSYYHALERAQVQKNERIFVQWFLRKYVKENRKYILSQ